MNKIILEVGLLAFCVSVVIFSTEGLSLLDTVARSFLVFMLVEVGIGVLLFAASSMTGKTEEPPARQTVRRPANVSKAEQNKAA